MPLERKQPEPEQQAGAPEWMVTFSDCMTLLLTFFVLLLSFSSFDDRADFRKMNSAFANQISFGAKDKAEKEAVSTIQIQSPNDDLQMGSEKPTLIDGDKNRFKKKTEPEDYLRLRTLLVASDEVFWGDGSVISQRGKQILTDVSLFLKELPGQMIIVSESGPKPSKKPEDIGSQCCSTLSYRQCSITQRGFLVCFYGGIRGT